MLYAPIRTGFSLAGLSYLIYRFYEAQAQAHGLDASTHSDQCLGDHACSSHVQNVRSECPLGPQKVPSARNYPVHM